jgi:cell division protein ZapE
MHGVHAELKTLSGKRNPLRIVADRLANSARIICFDEFFVNDIADAMLLGTLFEELFRRGVTLVATSNIPPDKLYWDGLQRNRFLPAIELVKQHSEVLHVDGPVDFRLRVLEQAEIYHSPLDEKADASLNDSFDRIAQEPGIDDYVLQVEGRPIKTRRRAHGVVWFDFEEICGGPRSQTDYIRIASWHHTVLISNIPQLDSDAEDQARRFVALVDEFYDRRINLIISAATAPEALYAGRHLGFEFERTLSRLREMQSHDYLAQAHIP